LVLVGWCGGFLSLFFWPVFFFFFFRFPALRFLLYTAGVLRGA